MSLRVIRNGTIQKLWYGFLLALYLTMAISLAFSEIFSIKELHHLDLSELGVIQGHRKWHRANAYIRFPIYIPL